MASLFEFLHALVLCAHAHDVLKRPASVVADLLLERPSIDHVPRLDAHLFVVVAALLPLFSAGINGVLADMSCSVVMGRGRGLIKQPRQVLSVDLLALFFCSDGHEP